MNNIDPDKIPTEGRFVGITYEEAAKRVSNAKMVAHQADDPNCHRRDLAYANQLHQELLNSYRRDDEST